MSIAMILLPVFVLVALTFVLIFTLGLSRASVLKRGEVRIPDIALGQRVWPPRQQQMSNCYDNQFQLPVLFYVLTILAIVTRHADYLFVVLAWIFVAARLVHAYIHCTSNYVRYRFFSFVIGLVVLIAMWAIFAAQILAGVSMTPAAKLAAAIEVFEALETDRRPAGDALKAWGLAHRFAGSGDRAGIAGLVYDALRRRASSAYLMGAETPRAILLGILKRERGLDTDAIAKLADGSNHGPAALSDDERARLDAADMTGAPPHVIGDYPDWLDAHFERVFGKDRGEEGAALASRAPVDLRVNALKSEPDRAASMLDDLKPARGRWSPVALRVALNADAKSPAIHAEPAFLKGMIEVQDEGSQLAALFAGAKPGEQVVDLCAGAGGKTLALAALMQNKGQIFATDDDKRRLAPIHDRLARSGARNVQVRTPKSIGGEIDDLTGKMDLVLIDAPCTGTGSWRRNPDAKWRMRPGALEQRVKEQAGILDRAIGLVKAGGRIAYITCSVLDEENGAQVRAFVERHPEFAIDKPADVIKALGDRAAMFGKAARLSKEGILMTPRTTATDGFFVSVMRRGEV